MPSNITTEIANKINTQFPLATEIVIELVNTIYDPNSRAKDLAYIIDNDSPLAVKILNLVNSVYYTIQ